MDTLILPKPSTSNENEDIAKGGSWCVGQFDNVFPCLCHLKTMWVQWSCSWWYTLPSTRNIICLTLVANQIERAHLTMPPWVSMICWQKEAARGLCLWLRWRLGYTKHSDAIVFRGDRAMISWFGDAIEIWHEIRFRCCAWISCFCSCNTSICFFRQHHCGAVICRLMTKKL